MILESDVRTSTGTIAASGADLQSKSPVSTACRVLPWAGDDFTLGHRLRDGDVPRVLDKAEKTVDVVIVGGGMAGLATGVTCEIKTLFYSNNMDRLVVPPVVAAIEALIILAELFAPAVLKMPNSI